MLAIEIMLGIYGLIVVVALISGVVAPRLNHWYLLRGDRDMQWLKFGDEPPGYKEIYGKRDESDKR